MITFHGKDPDPVKNFLFRPKNFGSATLILTQQHEVPVLLGGDLGNEGLEGLDDGLPVLGGPVPHTLQAGQRTLPKVIVEISRVPKPELEPSFFESFGSGAVPSSSPVQVFYNNLF